MKLYIISILLICQCLNTNACGIAVHNEITFRSLENYEPKTEIEQRYKHDLLDSPSYTQAGSFFPDWGYQCLGNNEQSEDAHWPTFIKTAIQYIREVYPHYKYHQDTKVKGLVSFIFAVMSHGLADVKWHSLDGLLDHFVVAMAKSDFHGNTEEAHLAADTGAEFTLRHSNKLSYLNETWHVPIQDIRAIYKRLYEKPEYKSLKRKVPLSAHIQYCMAAAFAASKIDVEFGQFMFGYYGSKSPFLIEELYDYYRGGIEDMSNGVKDCYPDMVESFEHGVEHTVPDTLCTNYFYTSRCRHPTAKVSNNQIENIYQHYDTNTGILTLTVNPSSFHSRKTQQHVFKTASQCSSFQENNGITLALPSASSARLGHQVVTGDFDGNGELDMAISAPYETTGSVFIVDRVHQSIPDNRVEDHDVRQVASQILRGHELHGRFGWSMTILDMNKDGIDDLVIAGNQRVEIYLGQKGIGLTYPHIQIDIEGGTSLSAADMNQDGFKDLVIGCPLCSVGDQPQVGKVFIVFSDAKYRIEDRVTIAPDDMIENPDAGTYQHFGEASVMIGNTWLVSAPNYGYGEKQRVGKIYAFDMPSKSMQWTMTGLSEFQQFGKVLATDEDNILLIASPSEETEIGIQTFWQAGTVRIYDWQKMNSGGSMKRMDHGMIHSIKGRSNAGHLGQSLSIKDNTIWIGEPMSEQENGRIYKLSLNNSSINECIKNNHVLYARFGSQIHSIGVDTICITSQRYGQNARYSGAVTLLQIK